MSTSVDFEQRHWLICERRKEGATLQAIADEFGVSRERVRQIINQDGTFVFDRVCFCGRSFQTIDSRRRICGECECATCGKKLADAQALRGQRYCKPAHNPAYRGANSGVTFRTVERGICVREYQSTSVRVNDDYYVYSSRHGWQRFDSIAKAREYRKNSKQYTGQSAKIRKAILAELEKGPARVDQLSEAVGIKPRRLGTYVRHMKGDGLIRTRKTEKVKYVDKPVWELVS